LYLPDRFGEHQELCETILIGSNGALGWARYIISLLTSPEASTDDRKFIQHVKEASHGFENELGRRIDEMRNRSSERSTILVVLILRRFIRRIDWIDSRELVELVQGNSDLSGRSENFIWSQAEIIYTATNLASPNMNLLLMENRMFLMPKAIRRYFLEHAPVTIPKYPPLWLRGDTCTRLACHFSRKVHGSLAASKCTEHGEPMLPTQAATDTWSVTFHLHCCR
jgi:hypothetical protein